MAFHLRQGASCGYQPWAHLPFWLHPSLHSDHTVLQTLKASFHSRVSILVLLFYVGHHISGFLSHFLYSSLLNYHHSRVASTSFCLKYPLFRHCYLWSCFLSVFLIPTFDNLYICIFFNLFSLWQVSYERERAFLLLLFNKYLELGSLCCRCSQNECIFGVRVSFWPLTCGESSSSAGRSFYFSCRIRIRI